MVHPHTQTPPAEGEPASTELGKSWAPRIVKRGKTRSPWVTSESVFRLPSPPNAPHKAQKQGAQAPGDLNLSHRALLVAERSCRRRDAAPPPPRPAPGTQQPLEPAPVTQSILPRTAGHGVCLHGGYLRLPASGVAPEQPSPQPCLMPRPRSSLQITGEAAATRPCQNSRARNAGTLPGISTGGEKRKKKKNRGSQLCPWQVAMETFTSEHWSFKYPCVVPRRVVPAVLGSSRST